MKIFSKKFNREFEVTPCPSKEAENYFVISHKSLQDIFDIELSDVLEVTKYEVVKDNPSHALFVITIRNKETGFEVTEIGEKKSAKGESEIAQLFPVTSAYTRAFDRAMIRILGLDTDGKIYSNSELGDVDAMDLVRINVIPEIPNAGNIDTEDIPSDLFTEEPVDVDVDVDESADIVPDTGYDEPVEAVDEPEDEEENDLGDPGDFIFTSGCRKGKTIREVYETDGGKGFFDFYLGGDRSKPENKEAIVRFYVANGIEPSNNRDDEKGKAAIEYFNATKHKFM